MFQPEKGYGNAYIKGLKEAKGRFLVMADADDTYNLEELDSLIKPLEDGYEMVIGSRFEGNILPGAMTWSHRYIGNPILTAILNRFFKTRISDAHSGFRAITMDAFNRLNLQTGGMEFASEMIVDALRKNLKIKEVPITYYPRKGESKLNSLPDAWRHIRFMLIYSPTNLFLVPGFFVFMAGFLGLFLSGRHNFTLFGHRFDVHAMVFSTLFCLGGFQVLNLGLFAKTFAMLEGYERRNSLLQKFYRAFNLEKGIVLGILLSLIGFIALIFIFYKWVNTGFGFLDETRLALFSLIFVLVGIQIIFSSFFLSLLGIKKKSSA